jgi:hypothetical protein
VPSRSLLPSLVVPTMTPCPLADRLPQRRRECSWSRCTEGVWPLLAAAHASRPPPAMNALGRHAPPPRLARFLHARFREGRGQKSCLGTAGSGASHGPGHRGGASARAFLLPRPQQSLRAKKRARRGGGGHTRPSGRLAIEEGGGGVRHRRTQRGHSLIPSGARLYWAVGQHGPSAPVRRGVGQWPWTNEWPRK